MTTHSNILIIGGGISGMLTARELRLAGQEVTILDKSALGRESSWAGGGILLPIYPWRQDPAISKLVIHSISRYPALNRELYTATGIDPEWQDCGMLICKNPDIDVATNWCRQYGISYQTAPKERLHGLNTSMEHALWLPEIAQIRNPRLLKSLQAYLEQIGVKFVENAEISNINISNQQIDQVNTNKGNFLLEQLVICSGAWSSDLLQTILPKNIPREILPIQPIKGQMLIFAAQPNTLEHMILDKDEYLIPRRDGNILAGSTVEATGFDKTTTNAARQRLYEFATGLLPILKQFPVRHHWAGLRPGTPQGIPYISRHPDIKNLSINAGHFRNGLVMGPASAQLLADLILNRPTAVDPQPYAIN